MQDKFLRFIEKNKASVLQTLRELCAIPAPSHYEDARAEYCKRWLEAIGATGVYIDEAQNVVFPINCENSNEIIVFAAHTDTVFPDREPLPYEEDEKYIRCPGVGDDTASVAVLLAVARYYIENKIVPKKGVLFVCNSCEEGLGNLKGTRRLFEEYTNRIDAFITFDGYMDVIHDECAGSHRYEVTVRTEGGHSFQKFGNENALVELSKIITAISEIAMPNKPGTRTTHNIGTVCGGTSVNTIAQDATMLCEYRSTDWECLEYMRERFEAIFKAARSEKVTVEVTQVGDRPCSRISNEIKNAFCDRVFKLIQPLVGPSLHCKSGSTDCNIPLSLGIPALCIGVVSGGGAHTREEWVEKSSLELGLEVGLTVALALTNEEEYRRV